MNDFIVTDTPELRLLRMLELVGIKAELSGGAVRVPMSAGGSALVIADGTYVGQWHVVAGNDGTANWFRGICYDTWSVLTTLNGIGLDHSSTFLTHVWRSRWAKANRLLHCAADRREEDLPELEWEELAKSVGEKPPSAGTIAVINHLIWEEPD